MDDQRRRLAVKLPVSPWRLGRAPLHEIELCVFLFLLVPALLLSPLFVHTLNGPFTLFAVASILRDASLVALVLFFVWRNGEPFARVGLGAAHPWREMLVGVVLFVPVTVAAALVERALEGLGRFAPAHAQPALTPGHGAAQMALAVVLVAVVAMAEETIFRGYILYRLREWTGSWPLAVLLSSGIFALGHGYEGAVGVVTVGLLGVALAAVYLWRGSLIAPMVMHFCQDFLAVVLVPAVLGHR